MWIIIFYVEILAIFGNFKSNFCLIHSSCWFYDHFFAWNNETQVCFCCETQKYVEILNNNWIIIFYIGILAIFGNFKPHFCLIHSSCWFYDHFFAWNNETQVCFCCETQKYVEILNNNWIITFYIGILAIFGNFWVNFCLVHTNFWLYDHLLALNHET